ncbi:SpoIID/LytB domain-containing protein [Lachnospiraceae bacterium]|jgi:stage II sporulation protein D|nr:SpoIID/LytB domain-containing protein [Lachnospiraceae bacterium]
MKKRRGFQHVRKKRIVSGFFSGNPGTVLLLLLLVPYLITFLFGNLKERDASFADMLKAEDMLTKGNIFVVNTTAFGNESIPLEMYVADQLARSIDNTFELEVLKAQAVLIRSDLLSSLYLSDGSRREGREIAAADDGYGSIPVQENILAAVSQTAGVCLVYEGVPVDGAYFAVSNGATRNGSELFFTEYPYLKSVVCSRDFLSPEYASTVAYDEGEFDRLWQDVPGIRMTEEEILENERAVVEEELEGWRIYRDSTGYVLYLEKGGKYASGEQFREIFRLLSSSFHLKKEGEQIFISVKGSGHGLGMSQFGANEMAKEGEDYIKILNYFFNDVIITKFE